MGIFFRAPNNLAIQNQQSENHNHEAPIQNLQQPNQIQEGDIVQVYIKFKTVVSSQQVQKVSNSPAFMKLIQNQIWCLNYQYGCNYSYLFSLIEQCQGVKTIKIIPSSEAFFQTDLLKMKFTDLNKLTLSKCNLQSVQFLSQIYMPRLKQLCLSQNFITRIKSLRKIISNIQILNIRYNPILNLKDDEVNLISFDRNTEALNFEESGKNYYGDDLSWYMRMPFKTLTRMQICGTERIRIHHEQVRMMTKMYKGENQTFCWLHKN